MSLTLNRYLVETDRSDEALRVLHKLHYDGTNEDWINKEFNEIKLTIEAEKAITAPGWGVMFKVKPWRTRLFHATSIQLFGQMTGYVEFYTRKTEPLLITELLVSTSSATTPPSCTTIWASKATVLCW